MIPKLHPEQARYVLAEATSVHAKMSYLLAHRVDDEVYDIVASEPAVGYVLAEYIKSNVSAASWVVTFTADVAKSAKTSHLAQMYGPGYPYDAKPIPDVSGGELGLTSLFTPHLMPIPGELRLPAYAGGMPVALPGVRCKDMVRLYTHNNLQEKIYGEVALLALLEMIETLERLESAFELTTVIAGSSRFFGLRDYLLTRLRAVAKIVGRAIDPLKMQASSDVDAPAVDRRSPECHATVAALWYEVIQEITAFYQQLRRLWSGDFGTPEPERYPQPWPRNPTLTLDGVSSWTAYVVFCALQALKAMSEAVTVAHPPNVAPTDLGDDSYRFAGFLHRCETAINSTKRAVVLSYCVHGADGDLTEDEFNYAAEGVMRSGEESTLTTRQSRELSKRFWRRNHEATNAPNGAVLTASIYLWRTGWATREQLLRGLYGLGSQRILEAFFDHVFGD